MKLFVSIFFSLLASACTKQNSAPTIVEQVVRTPVVPNSGGTFTYLALGDSYTIGESVSQSASFPYQLKQMLKDKGIDLAVPKIVATTGWTTDELAGAIDRAKITAKFDLVTLLIGVNNQYRGYPLATYKKEFSALLQTALTFAKGDVKRVFVISIPDWGASPFGQSGPKSPKTIAEEIDAFNAVNKEITLAAGIDYTDITPGSRLATIMPDLIAKDGLHPSEKMYNEWVKLLLPKIIPILK